MDYIFQIWNDVMYKINTEKNSIEKLEERLFDIITAEFSEFYYYNKIGTGIKNPPLGGTWSHRSGAYEK
jgi:hypothetical protein